MTLEEKLEEIVRRVVREELEAARVEDSLLTAEQVAEALGYSVHHVYRLKRQRKLNGIMIGDNSLRFKKSEVQRFIQERAA